ncbi:MAG: hydrogenase maturation nickel metallochaperone HypA [Candidatus Omnitrophota bacterium]
MHEIGIVDDILVSIKAKLKDMKGPFKIKNITISIGELEHISPEHFQFHFKERTKGTALETAELAFKKIPAKFKCKDCFREFIPKNDQIVCPACGSKLVDVTEGTCIKVESVEVE